MKPTFFASILIAGFFVPALSQADPQSDRYDFIQSLTSKGIFHSMSVEDNVPRLVVTPDFHDADLESKETAVGIVYQYYRELDESYDTLIVIDAATGAQIGTFTAEGLQL